MSYPCVDPSAFEMTDGSIGPWDYMQWRHVAYNYAPSVQREYPPNGPAINDPLHSVQAQWTNTSPIAQKVYALLTRGGSSVTLQASSRAYLLSSIGTAVGVSPADPAASTELSRYGIGSGVLEIAPGSKAQFVILETRMADRTMLLGSTVTVPPGQTYKARCDLSFKSENWETLPFVVTTELEADIVSGATAVDLYAYPVIT